MNTKQTEALKLALEALNRNDYLGWQTNIHVREAIREALAEQPALPFGIGGGLVAIKTLVSRDPCAHAKVVIKMIDAMLAEQPTQCWKCGDMDAAFQAKCTVPACGMKEQPAQQQSAERGEPVAWATRMGEYAHIHWGAKRPEYPMVYEVPLYTSPQPNKPWVGLTPAEAGALWKVGMTPHEFSCAIEAKLREKNA